MLLKAFQFGPRRNLAGGWPSKQVRPCEPKSIENFLCLASLAHALEDYSLAAFCDRKGGCPVVVCWAFGYPFSLTGSLGPEQRSKLRSGHASLGSAVGLLVERMTLYPNEIRWSAYFWLHTPLAIYHPSFP